MKFFAIAEKYTTPAVVRLERNLRGRDWAVGDIHGEFSRLQRALDQLGFDPRLDRLLSVGDLVDRGDESDQVGKWLEKPWFHAICGNHDLMAWRRALGRPLRHIDHLDCGGQWLDRLPRAERRRLGHLLAALPFVIEVETASGIVAIVHADFPSDDWRDLSSIDWRDLDRMDSAVSCCLWSKARWRNRYAQPIRNVRAVVHGHTHVLQPEVLGNVHFIDTGGWRRSGYFSFLELESLRVLSEQRHPKETAVP